MEDAGRQWSRRAQTRVAGEVGLILAGLVVFVTGVSVGTWLLDGDEVLRDSIDPDTYGAYPVYGILFALNLCGLMALVCSCLAGVCYRPAEYDESGYYGLNCFSFWVYWMWADLWFTRWVGGSNWCCGAACLAGNRDGERGKGGGGGSTALLVVLGILALFLFVLVGFVYALLLLFVFVPMYAKKRYDALYRGHMEAADENAPMNTSDESESDPGQLRNIM